MTSDLKFGFVFLMLVTAAFIWPVDSCGSIGIILGLLLLAHLVSSRSRLR